MRWLRRLRNWPSPQPIEKKDRRIRRVVPRLEELETRALLSVSNVTATQTATATKSDETVHPLLKIVPQTVSPQLNSAISGSTPQQIEQAYGVSTLLNSGTNGEGETIAIVDAYYDPHLLSDVQTFNTQFGLQQFNVTGGPTLKMVASGGGSASSVSQDPTGDWPLETSLDVEWAHAMAPQANIVLVEAADGSDPSIFNATQYAATKVAGVVAVSMSWGDNEFSSETGYDSLFSPKSSSNPNGANPGVSFVAASGDSGAGSLYPAASPYVLAVGGTTLGGTASGSTSAGLYGTSGLSTFASLGFFGFARTGGGLYSGTGHLSITPAVVPSSPSAYPGESAWTGSGGGPSSYEGYPSYQYNQPSIQQNYGYPYNVEVDDNSTGTTSYYSARMTPDVAYNADPNTGYAIYDTTPSSDYGFSGGWTEVGGTSAAAPQWASLIALADQQRAVHGEKPLDTNEVQNQLYNSLSNGNYAKVFHDVTIGSNGYSAGTGYDLATGLGTPIANELVPYLASTTIPLGQLPTIQGSGYGGSTATSASFGSTSFSSSSLYGFAVAGKLGGGLYTGAGSLSISPGSAGANGLSSRTGGVPLASAPVTPPSMPAMPLASPLTTSNVPVDDVATSTPMSAANFLGSVSALTSGLPSALLAGNTMLTSSTNGLVAQDTIIFGASGWKGWSLSWSSSSLGLSGSAIDPSIADVSEDSEANGSDSSVEDAISTEEDGGGEELFLLESAPAALSEGQVSDGGDSSAGSE